ncbi:metallophosphoesterase [Sphingosinicella sp.]|uniref:metallophosphoesterase n=1 Tax=Sphingosinicella sp. TaxID=1917971 RepID=UPI001837E8A4|nr:metallophosphoesterase [Sphingosinicella sp.]MBA4760009.1 metallophosphoesterase [Sphingosinicella sp.]
MPTEKKLRFVHLSDIHFSHRQASFGFDPDQALREAVIADIANKRAKLGPIDAILVSGDIAYAGKKPEYENAAQWLDAVTAAAGCDPTAVWLCPGNHDIDHAAITANPMIQDSHDKIRSFDQFHERDRELTNRLVQPAARQLFYEPLAAYNEFSARYQSAFFADDHNYAWEQDFILNDGSILRLRSLNTALLSGLADFEKSLFLGARAWTFPQRSGVEYLTIAHHPPSWLADVKEATAALEQHARIQLFGHEHDQRIQPGRDWIKLFAGSVNPHRSEPAWKPGYNIIEVYVENGEKRRLVVEVHAREWQPNPSQFRTLEDRGNKDVHSVCIEIGNLPPDFVPQFVEPASEETADAAGREVMTDSPEAAARRDEADFRTIVFRFFRLTLSKKNEIVGRLRLSEDSDSHLTDVERFKRALLRAKEQEQLGAVRDLIESLEGSQ